MAETNYRAGLGWCLFALVAACGGPETELVDDVDGEAGQEQSGGTSAGASSTVGGVGGAGSATGGSAGAPSGGAVATGGVATGGAGSSSTGGFAGVFGGAFPTGGVATGGVQAGGSSTGGAASGQGGSVPTGGSMPTGGVGAGGAGSGGSSVAGGGSGGTPTRCPVIPECLNPQSCVNIADCVPCDVDAYTCVDSTVYRIYRTTDGQQFRCGATESSAECVTARNAGLSHCCS
jgi:hypothetical protein